MFEIFEVHEREKKILIARQLEKSVPNNSVTVE